MWRAIRILRDPDPAGGGGGGNPPAGGAPPAGGGGAATITAEQINGLQGDAFRGILPEDIRGAGWMKDVNTFGDFVKKSAGAQSLLGQRAVPLETDPPEKWDAWFKSIGRLEKPEAYSIPKIDGVPEEYTKDAAEAKILQAAIHAGGLHPMQAKAVMTQLLKGAYAAEQAEKAASEKAYATLMDGLFGKDRPTIQANAKAFLAANLPDNVKPLLEQMDDKAWGVLLAATNSIVNKYVGEDTFRKGGTPPGGSGAVETEATIRAKMSAIMSQKEYQDPFLNRGKNTELMQQMESLRTKLREISGQK